MTASQKTDVVQDTDIFAVPRPRLFSIDAGRPFLADLASGLRRSIDPKDDDPLALSSTLILTPTRRSARALADAFLDTAPDAARASLQPKILPLGDVDEDEMAIFSGAPEDAADLPPAISPLERLLVLARFVAQKDKAFAGHANWAAAIGAARELAKLLDSFYTEEIGFDALASATPEKYARHWEKSIDFLEIVTRAWPAYLSAAGLMDPSQRRARLIDAQATRWAATPPSHPVIVAGTTGSAPAVARLIKTVAGLEKGAVILPGLDRSLAAEARGWEGVDDPHPQAGLKYLLEALGRTPDDVAPWPGSGGDNPRRALFSLALRPADATDDWLAMVEAATAADQNLAAATRGLGLIEAENEEAEATAVSIIMRGVLETPGKTVMMVTPDRDLSRRVALKMRRWNVAVDDSAGVPFSNTVSGTFLRLTADWLCDPLNPVSLLAMARSPLAGFGLDGAEKNRSLNALDKTLRGLRPQSDGENDLSALERKIARHRRESEATAARAVLPALAHAQSQWRGLEGASFGDRLAAHIDAAQHLAATADEAGETRLWRREDGETGAQLLADLQLMSAPLDGAEEKDYGRIFTQLIAGATVRRRRPAHPRIAILGPLEARLQNADHIILGGLNEGVWPAEAAGDPFLSRPMRQEIGLPSPERRIGLSAHDFAQMSAAGEVTLTRAKKAGGKPAKPSRWLVRLNNVLAGAKAASAIDRTTEYAGVINALDDAGPPKPVAQPYPKPPLAYRPSTLFVTDIEKWLRDPYAIYARHILRLRKLDGLDEQLGGRHVGQLFHKIFEEFARDDMAATGGAQNNEDALQALRALFDRHARDYGFSPQHLPFWRTSIENTLRWFIDFHENAPGAPAVIEETGTHTLKAGAVNAGEGDFTIKARADRIDIADDGRAVIYDYKSRRLPTIKQQPTFSPQLPLTAMIAEHGGFDLPEPVRVDGFYYLRMIDRREKDTDNISGADGAEARAVIDDAAKGLADLVGVFSDPDAGYLSQPRPQYQDDYGDYDHLARRREWSIVSGDDDGGGA